jgi:hypothetical protein
VGRSKNGVAMHCEQRFVGRHHVFTGGDGPQNQGARNVIATNQLDDHINIGRVDHGARIGGHFSSTIRDPSGAIEIEVCNSNDLNGTPGTPRNLIGIARQHRESSGTNGASTEKANAHGHAATRGIRPSRRNISRTPRTA